jgi:hypothetical protein
MKHGTRELVKERVLELLESGRPQPELELRLVARRYLRHPIQFGFH